MLGLLRDFGRGYPEHYYGYNALEQHGEPAALF